MAKDIWHPIKGAPKDGTEVWIRGKMADGGHDYEALAAWIDESWRLTNQIPLDFAPPTHFRLRPSHELTPNAPGAGDT